jgi:hypothetical protein
MILENNAARSPQKTPSISPFASENTSNFPSSLGKSNSSEVAKAICEIIQMNGKTPLGPFIEFYFI